MSSTSQALQIGILKEIPTSTQVIQTLKSLQKITQINIGSSEFKSQMKSFSEDHMILYKSHTTQEGSTHFVCFVEQQRDDDIYLNQLTGETFRVEPLEGLVLERKDNQKAKLDEVNAKHLKSLYEKLNVYLDRFFSGSYAATCIFQTIKGHFKLDAGALQEIIIGITSKYINSNNFSAGEWTSLWSFKSTQYSAKIQSRNHFHEGGNIIFNRPKTIDRALSGQDTLLFDNLTEETINWIVDLIQKEERLYQKQLENIYSEKLSQSLKKLRRISPLTQGKMIWNVNAVLLSEGLSQKLPKFF